MSVQISGHLLECPTVERIARGGEQVDLSTDARGQVLACQQLVQQLVESGAAIYGVTTGIGEFARIRIDPSQGEELQCNIIRSHAAGYGEPQPTEVVRAAMVARINTLAQGHSGIRLSTLETYIAMLNRGVIPVVYEKGSLGVSGDLSPLSQLALVVIGEGEAYWRGERLPGAEALRRAGLAPVRLTFKEGLALINGTQMMSGESCLLLCDAQRLLDLAVLAGAMSLEALKAVGQPFDARVHKLKPHVGQQQVAAMLREMWTGSGILADPTGRVQDGYSIRCTPQVLGPSFDVLEYARHAVETELNSAADNPLFGGDGDGLSRHRHHRGGRPLGAPYEPPAQPGAQRPAGLPRRGARREQRPHGGAVHAGGAARREPHQLPPGGGGQRQRQRRPGGPRLHGQRGGAQVPRRLRGVGMSGGGPFALGKATGRAYEAIRGVVPFLDADRPLVHDIEKAVALVRSGELSA
jgi:histidine ammonia-lyase